MNGTDFGLYDYVFSADTNKAFRVEQAAARRQHRYQHDAAQPQHAVRRHEVQRRRARRWRVRAARVHRPPVGRLAGLMTSSQTRTRLDRSRRRARVRHAAAGAGAVGARVDAVGARGHRRRHGARRRGVRRRRASFYVAVCHHVAIPREPAEMMSTQWFDPIATLGYLAARHHADAVDDERVHRRVPASARRRPRRSRRSTALSNGRLIVGIGAGHVEGEFDALGVSFAARGALTDARSTISP